jgi:hypothetical protein
MYRLINTNYTGKEIFMDGKFLTVAVSENEYARLEKCARDWGQSISSFVRERLGIDDGGSTDLLNGLIARVAEYPLGRTFPLRGLYDDAEWANLRKQKTYLARRFNSLMDAGILTGVERRGLDEYKTTTYARIGRVELKNDDASNISKVQQIAAISKIEVDELRNSFLETCGEVFDKMIDRCKIPSA